MISGPSGPLVETRSVEESETRSQRLEVQQCGAEGTDTVRVESASERHERVPLGPHLRAEVGKIRGGRNDGHRSWRTVRAMSQDQPGPSISEIRGLSDEEVIRRHDALTAYYNWEVSLRAAYVDELSRRSADRSQQAAYRLTLWTIVLAVVATAVSVASLVVAVLTLTQGSR